MENSWIKYRKTLCMRLRSPKVGLFILGSLLFSSCVHFKQVPLFQDLPQHGEMEEKINNYSALILQNNDIVSVTVTSLNPDATAPYNPPANQQQVVTTMNTLPNNPVNLINNPNPASATTTATPFTGYLVDTNGDISLPKLGRVHVAGLTTMQARTLITQKLEPYLTEPVVSLRIVNFRIAVLYPL